MTDNTAGVVAGFVESARAKATAVEAKAAVYISQIDDAHKQVVAAERSGHRRSLELGIAAGELLLAAKGKVAGIGWTQWCDEHLSVPQTTRSLYMRLAKNKDRLLKPDLATDDGRRISNALLRSPPTAKSARPRAA